MLSRKIFPITRPMKLTILKETSPGETRVAATPESVKKLVGLGHTVTIESGAGTVAGFPDKAFSDEGATIAKTAATALSLVASAPSP